MRLICPHCMSEVTVPDDVAGKEATCSQCGKSFPTPARYSADVVQEVAAGAVAGAIDPVRSSPHPDPVAPVPLPPPGYVPPRPTPVGTPSVDAGLSAPTPAAQGQSGGGYTHACGITISPAFVAWLPAVLLTIVLISTFFPWVGCFIDGTAVYSQRPWGGLFNARPNPNYRLEEAAAIPSGWLDKKRPDWLLLPFFLTVLVGLAFAWADRGLRVIDPQKLPPVAVLWPWRNTIVSVCAGLAFVFLTIQWLEGFGIERAIRQHISERFAERRANAQNSPAALGKVMYDEEQAFKAYNLEHTTWLSIALSCSALTALAAMGRIALDRRANKLPPRIMLYY